MDIEFSYQKTGGWNEVEKGVLVDGPLWACQVQHEGFEAFAISVNSEIEALEFALVVLKGEGPYPPEPIKAPILLTEEDEKWYARAYRSKYTSVTTLVDYHGDGTCSVIEI